MRNAFGEAVPFLIVLRPAHAHNQPFGHNGEIIHPQGDQFTASKGSRKAKQEHGALLCSSGACPTRQNHGAQHINRNRGFPQ